MTVSTNSPTYRTSSEAWRRLLDQVLPRTFAILRPPPKLTVSQWADKHRVLSAEFLGGQWDTGKAEYQREIMDAFNDQLVEEITVMKSARSGGTQAAINNPIGYYIHQDPGPMLVAQPGLKEGKEWSKDHLDLMVRDSTVLRELVNSDRVKDSSNEIHHKTFPGGMLYIIGAQSGKGFRAKTIQRVFLDDIDGYPKFIKGEGSPIALARKRTQTYIFHGRKICKVSTPTVRGFSLIEEEFNNSDQRFYFVPCPSCQHFQYLAFSKESQFAHLSRSFLRFDAANLSWVYYECENCHGKIEEKHKLQIVRSGRWQKQRPAVLTHAGFHISEMISPFSTWENMARDFLLAKRSGRESLRVFINQTLGETFVEDNTLELNDDDLMKRREKYTDVPLEVLVLTVGVDVQPDRLEVIVTGWGKDKQNWFVDQRVIIGSPEKDQTWEELTEYLNRPFRHASGMELAPWTTHGINAVCIDSGYSAQNVYRYVKRHQSRRFFATKGDEGFKKPWIINVHYRNKLRARLAILGVDSIKAAVYDRLGRHEKPEGKFPSGYMHFNEHCNQEFFIQLTAEVRKWIMNKWKWKKKKDDMRNEVLDCYVQNFAALELLNPDLEVLHEKMEEWLQREKIENESGTQPPPTPQVQREGRRDRNKTSWINNW